MTREPFQKAIQQPTQAAKAREDRLSRGRRVRAFLRRFALTVLAALLLLLTLYSGWMVHLYRGLTAHADRLAANRYHTLRSTASVVRPGIDLEAWRLFDRLRVLGYRRAADERVSEREFFVEPGAVYLGLAGASDRPGAVVRLDLAGPVVAEITDVVRRRMLDTACLGIDTLTCFDRRVWEIRRPRPFEAFPEDLIQAVLITEDQAFFQHPGLDARGVARAIAANVVHGRVVQGGSTITQQIVKVLLERNERTLRRKFDEAVLALFLERRYSKRDLLTIYLNNVFLGSIAPFEIRGMDAAARLLLAKELDDLTLEECALLAGLVRSPNSASPLKNPAAAARRTHTVLGQLRQAGDSAAAFSSPGHRIEANLIDFRHDHLAYPIAQIEQELARLRLPARGAAGNVQIDLALDPWLQSEAVEAFERSLRTLEARESAALGMQGALVVLDPSSGGIVATIGGRDFLKSQFNRAQAAKRPIGSVFKPFIYLTALGGQGSRPLIDQTSVLQDEPLSLDVAGRIWRPRNVDRTFLGPMSARSALVRSRNVPTVGLGMQAGLDQVVRLAQDMGLGHDLGRNPAVLLGSGSTSPLNVAAAYAALGNGGCRVLPSLISRVTMGDSLFWRRKDPAPVVAAAPCYIVTDMLRGTFTEGAGTGLADGRFAAGGGQPAAGKTGTTSGNRDSWFAGYTPALVAVVWLGKDDNTPIKLSGAGGAMRVWADVMQTVAGQGWTEDFECPPGAVMVDVCAESGMVAARGCPDRVRLAFQEDRKPTADCVMHALPEVGRVGVAMGGAPGSASGGSAAASLLGASEGRSPGGRSDGSGLAASGPDSTAVRADENDWFTRLRARVRKVVPWGN